MKRPLSFPLATTTLCAGVAMLAYGCEVTTSTLGLDPGSFDGGRAGPDGGRSKEPGRPDVVEDDEEDAGSDARNDVEKDAAPPGEHEDAEAGPPPPPPRKRVFVTKEQFTGDLKTAGGGVDGLDGGDRLCAAAATAANLGGTWKAWLSSSTVDALTRIADVAPWYLVDRTTLVFATEAQVATMPSSAIEKNETGSVSLSGGPGAVQRVWTGTRVGGTKSTSHCESWATVVGSGVVGDYVQSDGDWTRYAADVSTTCAGKNPIYCFEQ